jgi:hypothetical protein
MVTVIFIAGLLVLTLWLRHRQARGSMPWGDRAGDGSGVDGVGSSYDADPGDCGGADGGGDAGCD